MMDLDAKNMPASKPDHLPIERTSFIGRKRELAELRLLLDSQRLVTITGPAGCGKTRLALRLAADVSGSYRDGVQWVALAALTEKDLLGQSVARTLGLAEGANDAPVDHVVQALQGREILLVLDNCEHLLTACADLANRLLEAAPVRMLATSRSPLQVRGEALYPLSPMNFPEKQMGRTEIENFEAVQLFIARARASLPAFELTDTNAAAVARICQKLDGIPLAIELASAQVSVLAVEQIASRLGNSTDLHAAAARLTHSQHQTLHAALEWSHKLLSTAERILLRRLAVFAGGWSLNAAETVCSGEGLPAGEIWVALAALVRKSLVVARTLRRQEARYDLLEMVRQFGREKLAEAGEEDLFRDRQLKYVLQVVEETEPKLLGEYQQLWLDWLEAEFDNVRAALNWALASQRIETGLRIVIALYQFWTIRDYAREGYLWSDRLLSAVDGQVALAVHTQALTLGMNLAGFRGRSEVISRFGSQAARLAEAAGEQEDDQALLWALSGQFYAARVAGDHERAYELVKKLIGLHHQFSSSYDFAVALSIYSFSAMSVGEFEEAQAMLAEALPLLRELGNPYRIAMALNFSGDLARLLGDYKWAQSAYEECITLLRGIEAVRDLASALHNLGHACLHQGEIERAHRLFEESLEIHQAQHNEPGMTECLIGFAGLAVACGLPARGARLLAAVIGNGGERAVSAWAATHQEYVYYYNLAREGLIADTFAAEQAVGRVLPLDEALDFARESARQALALSELSDQTDALTRRERQVAALIAQARSNDEIAEELVISKRTVEKHVSNIRSKLGVSQRTEIVHWAIDNNLLPQSD